MLFIYIFRTYTHRHTLGGKWWARTELWDVYICISDAAGMVFYAMLMLAAALDILSLFHQQNILFYSDYVERTHHSEPIFLANAMYSQACRTRDG